MTTTNTAESLRVAAAIVDPRVLDGSHCVEVDCAPAGRELDGSAYWIRQIACCLLRQDPGGAPFLVYRHRGLRSRTTDPWPRWRALLGDGVGPHGFYGLCVLHLDTLLRPARLVELAADDRVPPEEPAWDPHRQAQKSDRFSRERAAYAGGGGSR